MLLLIREPQEPPVDPCAEIQAQRDSLLDMTNRAMAILSDRKKTQTTRIQEAKAILSESN